MYTRNGDFEVLTHLSLVPSHSTGEVVAPEDTFDVGGRRWIATSSLDIRGPRWIALEI